jgi:hypothetical protein
LPKTSRPNTTTPTQSTTTEPVELGTIVETKSVKTEENVQYSEETKSAKADENVQYSGETQSVKADENVKSSEDAPSSRPAYLNYQPTIEKDNSSIINQIIKIIDKSKFAPLVEKYSTEFQSKGFLSWDHFILMLLAQLGHLNSLREIVGATSSSPNRFSQLDLKGIPSISTISYANKHRDWRLFRDFFDIILSDINKKLKKFNKSIDLGINLYSLDSTIISLCLKTFDFALYRRTKGAIKLHLLLDHQNFLPCFMLLTEGKRADIHAARAISGSDEVQDPLYIDVEESRSLVMPKGSVIVMDRGYVDYRLFDKWTQDGIYFVTRPKTNMSYNVTKSLDVPEGDEFTIKDSKTAEIYRVIKDCYIELTNKSAALCYPEELRMVTIKCDENNHEISFITNNKELKADIISKIYKERWQIESFFRTIKQNLLIKTFLGTSENAVNCQIWAAMSAIVLVKYLQIISTISWSFSNLIALIRMNLFSYIKLYTWINIPHCDKPSRPPPKNPNKRVQFCRALF